MAAGVSAPTLAFADDALGLGAEPVTWEPAPLQLVAGTGGAIDAGGAAAPELRLLPDLEDR
jgi:hypothetical protein